MVFTGNVHKSHFPKRSRNEQALSHCPLSGPLAQLLPRVFPLFQSSSYLQHARQCSDFIWVLFFTVCDFAKMTPFRLHFHVAFALFVKTLSFFVNLAILQNQYRENTFVLILDRNLTTTWSQSFLAVPLWNSDLSLLRGGKRKLPICYWCVFHPCENVPKSSNFLRFLKCLVDKSQQRSDKLHQLKIF